MKYSCTPLPSCWAMARQGLFQLAPLEDMAQRPTFRVMEAGRVGPDVRLVLVPGAPLRCLRA